MTLKMVCFNGMIYDLVEDAKMVCFNGMIYDLVEDATTGDLSKFAKIREKQGYGVEYLSPHEVEINSDGLIDDRMGWLKLVKQSKE